MGGPWDLTAVGMLAQTRPIPSYGEQQGQISASASASEQHGEISASTYDSGITRRHKRLVVPLSVQQGQISVSAYASEQHGVVSVPTYDIRWEQQADVMSSLGVTARLDGA